MTDAVILSRQQIAEMSALQIASNPDVSKQVVSQILAAQQGAETAMKALADTRSVLVAQQEVNSATLDDIGRKAGAVEAQAALIDKRERDLAEREAQIAAVQNALNAEKAAFEQVRQQVDQQHKAHDADLSAREVAVKEREAVATKREADIAARDKASTDEAARVDDLHHQFRDAVNQVRASIEDMQRVISHVDTW